MVTGGARASASSRRRVACHRAGSQRGRRAPRAAGLASALEHALVSLLAISGLRVSDALGADSEAFGIERGHRTLTVLRKIVTIPLAPRTTRAIDLAIGERVEGPNFLGQNGERLDRHAAGRIVAPHLADSGR